MKKNFLKKVIIMALTAFAFGVEAFAQGNVDTCVSTNDFGACKEYLKSHPTDTIRSVASIVAEKDMAFGDTIIAKGDSLLVIVSVYKTPEGRIARHTSYNKTVVTKLPPKTAVDFEKAAVIDQKAEETQFVYGLTAGRRKDVRGFKSDEVKEAYDDVRGNAGVVVAKAADKDGWALEGQASYQVAEDCNSVGGALGVAYTGSFWQVYVNGGITRTLYTENANHDGNYWAYKAESGLLLQPFKFDHFDQNRLYFGGGVGWEHYQTDSRTWYGDNGEIYDMSSKGNYIYLHGDIKFEHRFFATGNSLYVKAQVRQKKFIYQNEDLRSKLALEFSIGMNLGFFRHRINNTK